LNEIGKGDLKDKTLDELWEEWHYWNRLIEKKEEWGAAVAAALEFRDDVERELRRRDRCQA